MISPQSHILNKPYYCTSNVCQFKLVKLTQFLKPSYQMNAHTLASNRICSSSVSAAERDEGKTHADLQVIVKHLRQQLLLAQIEFYMFSL